MAIETRAAVEEQKRVAGDWDAELELVKRTDAVVRERHGLSRR